MALHTAPRILVSSMLACSLWSEEEIQYLTVCTRFQSTCLSQPSVRVVDRLRGAGSKVKKGKIVARQAGTASSGDLNFEGVSSAKKSHFPFLDGNGVHHSGQQCMSTATGSCDFMSFEDSPPEILSAVCQLTGLGSDKSPSSK